MTILYKIGGSGQSARLARAPEFLQPFFLTIFLRQYSPVPILTGFFKKNQKPE
jgi:hypothetical protein